MSNGGARPGAGRKKGGKNAETIEREAALTAFRRRVIKHADELFDSQMQLARGCSILYRIDEVGKRKEHVIVTSAEEIKRFLDGETGADYYYITTEKPDNKAVDSLLDRALGKPTQSIEMSGRDGEPIETTNTWNLDTLSVDELRAFRDYLTRVTPALVAADDAGEPQPN